MFIHVDDPHPGRCLNYRADRGDPYRVKTKRCLEAEGTSHVCRFQPDPPPISAAVQGFATGISSATPRKPEPWVVPS